MPGIVLGVGFSVNSKPLEKKEKKAIEYLTLSNGGIQFVIRLGASYKVKSSMPQSTWIGPDSTH